MKTKRSSVERLVAVLKQLELGVTVMEVIRKVRSPPFCFCSMRVESPSRNHDGVGHAV